MATYSYAQLERLWINAGGQKNLAPLMAAIAMAESGGNSQAYNQSGATGLWQILGAVDPADQTKLTNPQVNAKEAVLKYKSQGLDAWQTYTNNAYQRYFKGSVPPSAKVSGSGSGGSSGASSETSSVLGGAASMVKNTGSLLHGTAVVLDRFYGLFAPGQGWRIVFGIGALLAGAGAFKAYTSSSAESGESRELPLVILLIGVGAVAAFMAMRPWPQASGKPVKPGAYLVDVLEGQPPPAGPPVFSHGEVQLTELGLSSLLVLWAAGKAGSALSNLGKLAGPASAAGKSLWDKLFTSAEDAAATAAGEGA